jgi:hypothetical protein
VKKWEEARAEAACARAGEEKAKAALTAAAANMVREAGAGAQGTVVGATRAEAAPEKDGYTAAAGKEATDAESPRARARAFFLNRR